MELRPGYDRKRADTDADGLDDRAELNDYHTDPCKPDTDGDGESDSAELANGTDPLDPGSSTTANNLRNIIYIVIGMGGAIITRLLMFIAVREKKRGEAFQRRALVHQAKGRTKARRKAHHFCQFWLI
ncbi:MAG: hypothetical protein Q6373_013520 [Candidatus Sigynarchaeota archaeon]